MHRPIEAGMTLVSRATPVGAAGAAQRTSLVIQHGDARRGRRARQRAVRDGVLPRASRPSEGVGERAPDHRLEPDGEPIAEVGYPVADDQTVRYAAASGDDFAIHLDDEFAR